MQMGNLEVPSPHRQTSSTVLMSVCVYVSGQCLVRIGGKHMSIICCEKKISIKALKKNGFLQ